MNTIKITIPEGYEIDTFNKETGEVSLKPRAGKYPTDIMDIPLPKTSWYITSLWQVLPQYSNSGNSGNRTIGTAENLEHEEDAAALIALAKLITLRNEYNRIDDFIPKFDGEQNHLCICSHCGKIGISVLSTCSRVLAFRSTNTADLFLRNFRDLIETAKPLL